MTTSLKPSKTMDFYDIAMSPPASVNPWKARLALNFKNIAHKTIWVPLPDIGKVRQGLGVPACRKLADGNDFFTLPILVDPNTNSKIGDSFDIAAHLQKTYPDSGAGDLFPPQEIDYTFDQDLPPWAPPLSARKEGEYDEYSKFNMHIDRAFSAYVGLMGFFLPFDSQASKDELVRRAGVKSWDDFEIKGEAREKMKESFRLMLGDLAKLFSRNTTGPFILGKQANYADLIVGGWVYMMHGTLPDNEWQEVRSWHGGAFGHLYDGLQKYAEVK
ncbi:uncharacterized protein F4817DRAFT_308533 [Daldinia loculata]|uniref:uncharacterized protein n=1 Tax=Daldinia loculata TaxID=103429 RepID=UPI0020C544A5|nr:uncharacterized protein F4817DRAFT_308533 [Daldinia loculata]KAI1642244.1 hypothetical protein F4817DRAFT_308533 [Daldinia loculata]